jgi:CRISPR-associated protein Csm1
MTSEEREKFNLGAMLHDIGKLKQRAQLPEDKGKNHSVIGYEWLKSEYGESLIAAAARNHHGSEPETWESNLSLIIYEADNLAASERKEFNRDLDIDQAWHREVQLACDFSRISTPRTKELERRAPKYWPLSPLGGWIIPQEKDSSRWPDAYPMLWRNFVKDFQTIKKADNHLSVDVVLHLLEKYTSLVPSITLQIRSPSEEETFRKHPDVSLFDHSKVTAAAAICLYWYLQAHFSSRWGQEILRDEITKGWEDPGRKPFLLIGGDLSGVQRFIYTISSKGALKSLKGRSFFLELFTEHVADRLTSVMKLSRCNILFIGGGHFYILGPQTEEAIQSISQTLEEINDYLFGAFNGTLLQCVEWVPMSKGSFKDASDAWAELSERLNAAKKRKWERNLNALLGPPAVPHSECLTDSCDVCGREDQGLCAGEPKMCPTCKEQFEFGEALQRACRKEDVAKGYRVGIAVLGVKPSAPEGTLSMKIGDRVHCYKPILLDTTQAQSIEGRLCLYRLNDWDLSHFTGKGDCPMLAGIFHPRRFEELDSFVQEGFGWNRAAILRMDVDHLGHIFTRGLPKEDRTFSRMASLSRLFSLFFKYHLNGIFDFAWKEGYENLARCDAAGRRNLKLAEERNLSIVYSGGDDLFLIGQWLDVLEAAFDVYNAFRLFTGNPEITLSGGYSLGDSRYPVYRFATDSGEAESRAKGSGRDALCLFNHPFKWQDAHEIKAIVDNEILPLLMPSDSCLKLPQGSFSTGFLYRLLALLRAFQKEQAWILPKIAYAAGRNGPQADWLNKNRAAAEAWMQLKQRLFRIPEENHLKKLERAILWTLMMMKKGGER